jgi:CheY-like chemotaxis protein
MSRKKILIVDDEAHIRFLLEQTLEDFEDKGVVIESVENGREALTSIEKEKPDMVFLDIMMPEVNGFEVCKAIKENPDLQDIFVVLLTAKGQEADRIRGDQVGADLYLTKPFDPDRIVEITEEKLSLRLEKLDVRFY